MSVVVVAAAGWIFKHTTDPTPATTCWVRYRCIPKKEATTTQHIKKTYIMDLDPVVGLLLVLGGDAVLHLLVRPQLHDAPTQRAVEGGGQGSGLEDLWWWGVGWSVG